MKGMVEIIFDRAENRFEVWLWVTGSFSVCKGTRKSLAAARNLANRLGVIYSEPAH